MLDSSTDNELGSDSSRLATKNYERVVTDPHLVKIAFYLKALFMLALLYSAYFASIVLVPFVVSVMLALALAPLVRLLTRIRFPSWLGAAVVVVVGLSCATVAIIALSAPAAKWISEAPAKLRTLEPQLLAFQEPIRSVQEAGKGVGDLSLIKTDEDDDVTVVKVLAPSAFDVAVSATPGAIAASIAVIFFLYFLLASGQRVAMKLTRLLEYRVPQKRIQEIALQVQSEMSHYLLTVSFINIMLGSATALMLWLFGVPDPLLWGAVVATLNFAPYIGAVTSTIMIATVVLIESYSVYQALLVSGCFLLLTVLEGQLFTPVILGRRLALSPYIVFIAIIFWGWLWGIPGALMAVPIMVCTKIICDQFDETKWLAVLVQRENVRGRLGTTEPPF